MISPRKLFFLVLAGSLALPWPCSAAPVEKEQQLGPLIQDFDLTLSPGHRTEMVGPLFYSETKETATLLAFPPLFSITRDPGMDSTEVDFAYPVITYRRYGTEHRWHFMEVLSYAGGEDQAHTNTTRSTSYPFFFRQRSGDTNEDYSALAPFYGHVKHRLFKDEIFFAMFPLYARTRKGDVITENYLYPFYHQRHGNGLEGWQLWPFLGHEHKEPTTRTNRFGDPELVPGHDRRFALWPVYLNTLSGLGTTNARQEKALMPFYSLVRSPQRDSTTVGWPFITHVIDRENHYNEWQTPWPVIEFARGEGKTTSRIWPFYSHAQTTNLESRFCPWLLYKYNRVKVDTLERTRTRIALYLYSDVTEKNTQTGTAFNRRDLWPLYTWRREPNGNRRLQILAPVEPIVPNNRSLERDYSPMWSLWRSEYNATSKASCQSLLWNLFRQETAPGTKKDSLLFGLFQYHSTPEGVSRRWFYFPAHQTRRAPQTAPKSK